MSDHVLGPDDCLKKIAYQYGFAWETLWNHPANAELKKLRLRPEALEEGDTIHIPDPKVRNESCVTEKKHLFRKKIVPSNCNQLLAEHELDEDPLLDLEADLEEIYLELEAEIEEEPATVND